MKTTYTILTLLTWYTVNAESDNSTINSTIVQQPLDSPIDSSVNEDELKRLLVQSFTEGIANMASFQNAITILELDKNIKQLLSKVNSLASDAVENKAQLRSILDWQAKHANCSSKDSPVTITKKPSDCYDLLNEGNLRSGTYYIYPRSRDRDGKQSIQVYCDMTTAGGGWTVIQRRSATFKPRIDFYRGWSEYKNGFGLLDQEFWLGLENVYRIVSNKYYSIRFDLVDFDNESRYAEYSFFNLGPENEQYKLNVTNYTGNAGDSFTRHNGMKFSTKDQDNDSHIEGECTVLYHGAWWYGKCHASNLNGRPYEGKHDSYADGIDWKDWRGYYYSLKSTEMKIRPTYPTVHK